MAPAAQFGRVQLAGPSVQPGRAAAPAPAPPAPPPPAAPLVARDPVSIYRLLGDY